MCTAAGTWEYWAPSLRLRSLPKTQVLHELEEPGLAPLQIEPSSEPRLLRIITG